MFFYSCAIFNIHVWRISLKNNSLTSGLDSGEQLLCRSTMRSRIVPPILSKSGSWLVFWAVSQILQQPQWILGNSFWAKIIFYEQQYLFSFERVVKIIKKTFDFFIFFLEFVAYYGDNSDVITTTDHRVGLTSFNRETLSRRVSYANENFDLIARSSHFLNSSSSVFLLFQTTHRRSCPQRAPEKEDAPCTAYVQSRRCNLAFKAVSKR